MTADEFAAECDSLTIAPEIALENDSVLHALEERDDAEVRRRLLEDF